MGGLRYYKKVDPQFLQYPMSQGKIIGGVRRRGLDGHNILMYILQLLQIGSGIMDIEIIAEYMIINKTLPQKRDIFNRAAHLVDVVGLARRYATVYPHELDGGRRQRIGVARALSVNPKFIVCNEPVSALDVLIQAQILNLLMDLQDDMGLTYMFVTHDLSVVQHISDNIMVMYIGQCLELTNSDELFANPVHPCTQVLLSAIPEPNISMRNKEVKVIKAPWTQSPAAALPSAASIAKSGATRKHPF